MKWITSTLFTVGAVAFTRCTYLSYQAGLGTTLTTLTAVAAVLNIYASYLAVEGKT